MDVVGALVGVDRFQVHHVADDVVLVANPVAAVHVARLPGDLERLAAGIALHQRDHLRGLPAVVHQPAQLQRALQAERDLGLHVGQLLLDQLGLGERLAELLAVEGVLPGGVPAELRRADRAPGDPVARLVEAAERPLDAGDVGQEVVLRHEHLVHHDLAGVPGAKGELALDLRRGQAVHAAVQDEAADPAVVRVGLRPDDEHLGDRRGSDPDLRAGQGIAAVDLLRPRLHRRGVGAGVRLGQAEAAEPLPARQLGQVLLLLAFAAVGVDRVHHQRGLHTDGRAVGAVDPLDLARDQTVGDVVHAGPAVGFRDGGAEQAKFAHLADDRAVGALVPVGFQHARHQLVLAVVPRGVADHPLLVAQLRLQPQRVRPVERRLGRGLRVGLGRGIGGGHGGSFRSGAKLACPGARGRRAANRVCVLGPRV